MEGKVYTITGAAGGIGLSAALGLAARGAFLSLADIKVEELQKAQETIAQRYPASKVIIEIVDIRKRVQVDAWIAKTKETFGKIHGCVNSAGILGSITTDIPNVTEVALDLIVDINLKGTFNCLRAQLPNIVDGASIVNIASMAGLSASPFSSPYGLTKAAIISMSTTAAKENAGRNIRVNAVCPGMTETPMLTGIAKELGGAFDPAVITGNQLYKRAAKVEEVSGMVLFLLSSASTFMTGVAYPVSGGWNV